MEKSAENGLSLRSWAVCGWHACSVMLRSLLAVILVDAPQFIQSEAYFESIRIL